MWMLSNHLVTGMKQPCLLPDVQEQVNDCCFFFFFSIFFSLLKITREQVKDPNGYMLQWGRLICFGCMHVRVLPREFVAQETESLNSQEGWESEKWCRLVSSWATVLFSTWWLIMPIALSTFLWNLSAYFLTKLIFYCRIRKPSRCFIRS